jgi:hypothetical protein
MPVFVQSLERRFLLSSVTGSTLAADYQQVVADAAAANAALKTLAAELKTDNAILATDLKTLPKSNAKLLATLKTDETKANSKLTTELGLLLTPATTLAKNSASVGELLTTNQNAASIAKAKSDDTALNNITSTPLANLTAALGSTTVTSDLNALAAANPSDTTLAAAVNTATRQVSAQDSAIGNDAAQFATDVATLALDLSSLISALPPPPGNAISELNNIFADSSEIDLYGSTTYTRGSEKGQTFDEVYIYITAVDDAGNITGGFSAPSFTYKPRSLRDAKVTSSGKFSAKVATSIVSLASLSGQFTIDPSTGTVTLTGTFQSGSEAGTFTANNSGQ